MYAVSPSCYAEDIAPLSGYALDFASPIGDAVAVALLSCHAMDVAPSLSYAEEITPPQCLVKEAITSSHCLVEEEIILPQCLVEKEIALPHCFLEDSASPTSYTKGGTLNEPYQPKS